MSPVSVFNAIPASWKVGTTIFAILGVGFTIGGATIGYTAVPAKLEKLEQLHREDIDALKDVTEANKRANETSNQKLDRVICLLEAQSGMGSAISCAN